MDACGIAACSNTPLKNSFATSDKCLTIARTRRPNQEITVVESRCELNEIVPDFSAAMTSDKTFNLSDYRDKTVVLYFYPKDNTPGCTTESMTFRDLHSQFKRANTVIFGISRDSIRSHEGFKDKLDLPFELISDPDEALCGMFDVMKMKTMYGKQARGIERSTFVIDATGKLVKEWRGVKVPGHVEEVLEYVKALA
jgi:thioredoxin-dependent peroxiredoxin